RYRHPGALPTVAEGRLKDDLMRRDFSINAIALDIMNNEVHDPAGGERDLRARLVRVLHDESFVDDPTRIFRAIRLATRLGFQIEPRSDELLRRAIAAGALETVSKERIWRELFLAMEEQDGPAALPHPQARLAGDAQHHGGRTAGAGGTLPSVPQVPAPAARQRPRGAGWPAHRQGAGADARGGLHRRDRAGPGAHFCARDGD